MASTTYPGLLHELALDAASFHWKGVVTAWGAWIFYLATSYWASYSTILGANARWKQFVLSALYLVPALFFPVGALSGRSLVSAWFIALAVARATPKLLLGQGSVVLVNLPENLWLSMLLIGTACIPPATEYRICHYFAFQTTSVIVGVEIDPVVWTHTVLWLSCYSVAWIFTAAIVIVRVCKYRHLANVAQSEGDHHSRHMDSALIIHASVGAGHKRAAQAIEEAMHIRYPDCKVQVVDIVDIGGPWFEALYKNMYLKLVDKSWGAYLVGWLFDMGNEAPPGVLKRWLEEAFLLNFFDFIYRHDYDLVIHTHFLSLEFLAMLRRNKSYFTPHVTVVTDFDAHAYWALRPCERYFVARREAMLGLTHHGLPEDCFRITGIPIVPAFATCPDRATCLQELGLAGQKPLILLISFGSKVVSAFEYLMEVQQPLEIVVVTGRQADIRAELEEVEVPGQHDVKLEGFTKVIEKYMKCADLLITKPGGLTTSECLASGCGMVIVNPYPGQEVRNSDMLLEGGCAVKCTDLFMLGHKVESIVRDPTRLAQMKQNALALSKPNAAFDIVDECAQLVREGWLEGSSDEDDGIC